MRPRPGGKSARHDEEERGFRQSGEQRDHEAERGSPVILGKRRKLVQRAEHETALRQMLVERGQAEGKHMRRGTAGLESRQQAAQVFHGLGAAAAGGKGGNRFHGCQNVSESSIEQNKNMTRRSAPLLKAQ